MLVGTVQSDRRHDAIIYASSPYSLFGLHPTKMPSLHFLVLVLFPYSFLLLQQAEIIHNTGDIGAVWLFSSPVGSISSEIVFDFFFLYYII